MDELARDAAKLRELEQQVEDLRDSIRVRVRAELRSGTPQVELVKRTGWTRETIRKIERRGSNLRTSTRKRENP
ncbi:MULTISPECIES: hypothetical protein [Mycobacteriaceae]|uniref:hypothetical protein n=1 Tax=Mycobacteriaceae TaxID=1762 RepID=UPI00111C3B45|nr:MULTISPECIES: hypothetical protein [Mycobacteriaceae]MBU8839132.1 hypothetical protein [Mycolicibacterium goodii]UCN12850.1 hypothetical protein LFT50_28405 [Mycobacterium intracellulare subsp. chimaera]